MNKAIKQAFTLIELLVVIAIIGILSGLIIVGMSGMTNSANIAKSQVFSNSLRNALLMNLVSEWKMDEGTGQSVADAWNGGNSCMLGNTTGVDATDPAWTTTGCVSGKCLSFDGGNDYIDCGGASSLKISKDITIGAWIKPDVLNPDNRVFANFTYMQNGYAMNVLSTGNFYFATWQSGTQQTTTSLGGAVVVGSWSYIVVTRSGAGAKTYRNGVDVTNSFGTHLDPVSSTVNAMIGDDATNSWPFDGLIDEVRIYNVAMPTSQIKEQYYAGLNKLLINGEMSFSEHKERILNINNLSKK